MAWEGRGMIWKSKVRCCNCGTHAKKLTESYWSTEPYKGNLQIVKDSSYQHKDTEGNVVTNYSLSLWDGESYTLYAGKFCTNRCAIEWANNWAPDPEE
mgnify:FL=1|tara:strand:- start:143 stop:436 length:294 start_codon:yes stop_codon:yes gene_type:complete